MNKKKENFTEEFYIVVFVIYKKIYTLWFTSDTDGFVLDKDGIHIKSFDTEEEVKIFAVQNNLNLNNEITNILCNENNLLNTCYIDCNYILTFWNIVSDIADTINIDFLGNNKSKKICNIYNKLFYGCNLPALKKEEDDFTPEWNDDEKCLIQKVMKNGLQILKNSIGC